VSAQVSTFLYGAITCASLLIGIKFLRFWHASRDRFFLWFAAAFWTFAAGWVIRAFVVTASEDAYYVYVPRLLAFVLIIAAILDKNRASSS
jgi:Family of unknown function (DUF5985)